MGNLPVSKGVLFCHSPCAVLPCFQKKQHLFQCVTSKKIDVCPNGVPLKAHIEYLPPPNELMLRGVYGSGGFCVAATVLFPSVGELFELN